MRRLFLVLDLSLLRQPEEQRQQALQQLTTVVGRLWASQHTGGDTGAAERSISWGYTLHDSACSELLLKPKIRSTSRSLREEGWRRAAQLESRHKRVGM